MSTFPPRDPSEAEKRICYRLWKHLQTTQWKVFGKQGDYQNCFGWALGLNDWVEDFGADDELNEAFVYKKRECTR